MQGLGGMNSGLSRGASMSGNKPGGALSGTSLLKVALTGATLQSGSKTLTWTVDTPGLYEIALWGPGAGGSGPAYGGGGALCIKRLRLSKSAVLSIEVGNGAVGNGTPTTVTLPDGAVLTAGGGNVTAGGVASGGDTNVSGNAAVGSTPGSGASYGNYIGGPPLGPPGGGAASAGNPLAGGGQCLITLIGE